MIKNYINKSLSVIRKKFLIISNNPFLLTEISKKKIFIFYVFIFSLFIFSLYLLTPKFFDLNKKKDAILTSLLENNSLVIKDFSNINYYVFPTPRIVVENSEFNFAKSALKTKKGDLIIMLNITDIINIKNFKYRKIQILDTEFETDTKQLDIVTLVENSKKKLNFKNIDINFLDKKKYLFKIKKINSTLFSSELSEKLNLEGFIGDRKKISINYLNNNNNQNNFIIKIPDFDTMLKINFLNKKQENPKGIINLEVLSSHVNLNFEKDEIDSLKILNSFIRNDFLIASFDGQADFKPTSYFSLNTSIKELNLEKIKLLLNNLSKINEKDFKIYKRLNGLINFSSNSKSNYKNDYNGQLIFQNGEIVIKDFTLKGNDQDYYLNGLIKKEDGNFTFNFNFIAKIVEKKFFDLKKNKDNIFEFKFKGTMNFNSQKIYFDKISLNNKELNEIESRQIKEKFEKINIEANNKLLLNPNKIKEFLLDIY